nr:MAG TPA: hypothetical protein [Caudoviricetes sp.]
MRLFNFFICPQNYEISPKQLGQPPNPLSLK